ncbi:lytic transglycosylase domain-containing protein [Paraburkholderia sp.]|uniref:lytic transglycosylase domain-containing protein n=1 Tax=Paraburkholderia sp. TaxID=1926495 RepID=UPI003D6F8169
MHCRSMRVAAVLVRYVSCLLLAAFALTGTGVTPAYAYPETAAFDGLARACAPNVDPSTLAALVRTESGFNPFAIGVVGGHLERQPVSLAEALATVRELDARGFIYSVGLTQVNNRNFAKYGETAATLFEPCRNLHAGAAILTECFARSSEAPVDRQIALRAALSCYYSGNFTTGFRAGYVGKVVTNARIDALRGGARSIPVVVDAGAVRHEHSATSAASTQAARAAPSPPRTLLRPVRATVGTAPSCHAAPIITVCRGLSAAQIRALCVRCLPAH